jgi:hypothetical protein
MHSVRVGDRDHRQRDEVVHDRDREHERAQADRRTWRDEPEHPERKGGIGRHRDSPATCRGLSHVQRQEDRDRDEHRSQTGADGHRQPAPLAQFADVEFSARLETDREEEQRP